MKLSTAVVLLGLAFSRTAWAAPEAAPPAIEGLWRASDDDSQIEIQACGGAICGRLVTSDDIRADPAATDDENHDKRLRSRLLKGLPLLSGFTGGPTEWSGGALYNPLDGATYRGSMRLEGPDRLRLTGCIVYPLCKSTLWTRVR